MKAKTKQILAGAGIVAFAAVLFLAYYAWQLVRIGAAYKAKMLCSGVFVAMRDPKSILAHDLAADDLSILRHINASVDYESPSVTSSFLGVIQRKAVYRPRTGCALSHGASASRPRLHASTSAEKKTPPERVQSWPMGQSVDTRRLPQEVDAARLGRALDAAFSEPDPTRPRRTRAVVIAYKGRIVAERYAPDFGPDTPLIGWSMTKSVVNALVGILVKEGKLSLGSLVPIPEWQKPSDPRSTITLDHLLRMVSGLKFAEDYTSPLNDVIYMLLGVDDMAAYAASKQLEARPGSKWYYSSGTTNIISRVIRQVVGDADYLSFPRRALFERIGMHSAVMETDASGTFVGSSFMYATARDWARFGLLYLQDGLWAGERILPAGWVQYTRTPTPQAPRGEYGAHFWLQIPEEYRGRVSNSRLPADAFHAVGHEGQFVTIIPSRHLVVVRLGLSRLANAWDHEAFIGQVLEAISR